MTARILITGSRTWIDEVTINLALMDAHAEYPGATMVSGGCPSGADGICELVWRMCWGLPVELHEADWQEHGKRAGFIRNAEMVNLGADLCLAFIKGGSRWATHTADLAEKAGIPTRRFTA